MTQVFYREISDYAIIVKEVINILIGYLAGKLIDAMAEKFKEPKSTLYESIKISNFKKLYKDNGNGLWYSYIENDFVFSLY